VRPKKKGPKNLMVSLAADKQSDYCSTIGRK
jgi:hypothetical protein